MGNLVPTAEWCFHVSPHLELLCESFLILSLKLGKSPEKYHNPSVWLTKFINRMTF